MAKNAILLSGPDRKVPFRLRVLLYFGGPRNQLAWILAFFTSIHIRLLILPELTHLERAMQNPLQWVNFGLLLLALTSGIMISNGVAYGNLGLRLLRSAFLTTGHLRSCTPTGGALDGEPVYRLVFSFALSDGKRFETTAYSTDPARLKDDAHEPLVYDGEDPTKALMLDDIPGRPRIDELGSIRLSATASMWPSLFAPVLIVLTHSLWSLMPGR